MEKRGHRFSPNVEFVRLFDGFAAQRLGIETLERSLKIEMNRVSLTVIEPLVELNFLPQAAGAFLSILLHRVSSGMALLWLFKPFKFQQSQ